MVLFVFLSLRGTLNRAALESFVNNLWAHSLRKTGAGSNGTAVEWLMLMYKSQIPNPRCESQYAKIPWHDLTKL